MRRRRTGNSYGFHSFYCLKCGNKSYDLPRAKGSQHERFHRKKLFCWHCQQEINHIECKSFEDVEEFKKNFANGVYKDEADDSLASLRGTWIGQKYMDTKATCRL